MTLRTMFRTAATVALSAMAFHSVGAELGNLNLSREQVRFAQSTLSQLGYEPGPADGLMGSNTRDAFRAFIDDNGFEDDGEFGEADVALLRAGAYNASEPHGLSDFQLPVDWTLDMSAPPVMQEREALAAAGFHERYTEERGVLWRENCESILTNIQAVAVAIARGQHDDRGGPVSIQGCIEGMGNIVAFTNDFAPLAQILLAWSEDPFIEYPDVFNGFYEVISAVTVFGAHYAIFYDEYPLSPSEREQVDRFLASAVQVDIVPSRSSDRPAPLICGPETLDRLGYLPPSGAWVDNNTCGSLRWKLTVAQVALALRLSEERLWEQARYNTQFMLNMFDEDNIFVTWAVQSGLAINYSKLVPQMLGVLTELYQSAGYDLLEHRNMHGSSVADMFGTYWSFMTDGPTLRDTAMHKYASRPLRNSAATVAEVEDISMTELFRRQDVHPYTFLRWSKRYAERYDANLLDNDSPRFESGLNDTMNGILNTFGILDVELLRLANGGLRAEPNYCPNMGWTEADEGFAGEWSFKWTIRNEYDDSLNPQGTDLVVLENGEGIFTRMHFNNPRQEYRKELEIMYGGGEICIGGEMNLFDPTPTHIVIMTGDFESGEVRGKWPDGDDYIVELSRLSE